MISSEQAQLAKLALQEKKDEKQSKNVSSSKTELSDLIRKNLITGSTNLSNPKQQVTLPAPKKETGSAKGYYTKPELNKDADKFKGDVDLARGRMNTRLSALKSAEQSVQEHRKQMQAHLQKLVKYDASADSDGTKYRNLQQEYVKQYTKTQIASNRASNAYNEYKPYEDAYNTAVNAYNSYLDDQQKQYNQWKSTIRSEGEIRKDLVPVEDEIEKLEKQINDLRRSAAQLSGTSTQMGLGINPLQQIIDKNEQEREGLTSRLENLKQRRDLLQEELEYSQYFKYADLKAAEDFGVKSGYVPTANGNSRSMMEKVTGVYSTENSGWDDPLYEYINGNQAAGAYISEAAAAPFGTSREAQLGAEVAKMMQGQSQSQQMTEDEVSTFNYLYATKGKEAAYEYYKYLQTDLNYRQRKAEEESWAKTAKESPVASSVASVLTSPLKGLSYVGQTADMAADGKMDQNAAYNRFAYTNTAIRNSVGDLVEEKWGPVGSFAYQTGMSMADFLINSAAGGGTQAGALAIMGTGAAADTTIAAKDRGLSDKQAFALGTVAGAAEIVTEKISIDALLDKTSLGKSAVGYIFKNVLAEGSEEVGSDIINLAADLLISKDKSEWHQSINAYKEQGYSEKKAFLKALGDQAINMGSDFLGGAVSGGVFATGSVALNSGKSPDAGANNSTPTQPQRTQPVQSVQNPGSTIGTPWQWENDTNTQISGGATTKDQILREMMTFPPVQEVNELRQRVENARDDLEATGIYYGVDQETIDSVRRISEALGGKQIEFYREYASEDGVRNGYYTRSEDSILINTASRNPVARIIGHELTHSVELADAYSELKTIVKNRIAQTGGNLDAMRSDKAALYEKNGVELTTEEVDQEIVAEYIENNLLTDEQSIMELVRDNRSVARKILDWLDNLLAKLRVKGAQERQFVLQARDAYRTALQQSQAENATAQAEDAMRKAWAEGDDAAGDALFEATYSPQRALEEQSSYAGPQAAGADLAALERARNMQAMGIDNETIRKETGWFEGADGKMRWEIDDSKMRYHSAGDARFSRDHQGYARHQELTAKMLNGDLTDEEQTELRKLEEIWGRERSRLSERVDRGSATLEDILEHDELFEAYPELRDVKVRFEQLPSGTRGQWDRENNTIVLSRELRNSPEGTLIHEIQHAIQKKEGFGRGSSVEYWMEKLAADRQSEVELADKKYRELFASMPEELKNKVRAYNRANLDYDYDEAIAIENELLESEYGELFSAWQDADFERRNLRERYEAADLTEDARSNYWNTAGEIEARDSSSRRNLNAEQRRATAPDLGDDKTVFVDSSAGYMMSKEESDSVKDQIRSHQAELNNMKAVATISDNGWKGMDKRTFKKKIVSDLKKTGFKVDRQGLGIIEFDEAQLTRSVDYMNTNAEAAAYQAIPQVLKRGIEISDHSNHKSRGYDTITIAAPVVINGKRGNMAVVVRFTKGARYKVHRILMPDGNAFDLPDMANAESTNGEGITRGATQRGEVASPINSASNNSLAEQGRNVNRKYSISDDPATDDRQAIVQNLKGILNRGGDVNELRRYVESLERGTGGESRSESEAQQILKAARDSGQSVEEYLRWNWEQYETEDGWNDAARKALDMERRQGRRQYSISDTDSEGRKLSQQQMDYFADSQVRDREGRLLTLYHQTENDFTVFDPRHPGAGSRDNQTPFGIFLKSTGGDIGLKGQNQMELYANITNPLRVADRGELERMLRELSPEYGTVMDEITNLNSDYENRIEQAQKATEEFMAAWRKENPNASRTALYDVAEYNELSDAEDTLVDEWVESAAELDTRAKNVITDALRQSGYDGVIIETDQGSWGRKTDAFIALSPEQVKNVDNQNPTKDRDIRYSISEDGKEQDTAAEPEVDVVSTLPAKALSNLNRLERDLVNSVAKALDVPYRAQRDFLQGIVREISEEYLRDGRISQETADRLFDTAYEQGIVVDREFLDTYKPVKDYLRTTALTISERDQADIADFADFKKSTFGKLRIKKEGGLPVDTAWGELQEMAPDLFPEHITHPADMLQHMNNVARSIKTTEYTLDQYYGEEAETFKRYARNSFDTAVSEATGKLWEVRRFKDETAAKAEATQQMEGELTQEDLPELYKQLKETRRNYEKVRAKNLLTDSDEMQVNRLLRHEILPEHLESGKDNVRGITAVYEAKAEYEAIAKQIRAWNTSRKSKLAAEADQITKSANAWKDKGKGIMYSRETMERNIRDIVNDRELAERIISTYFTPVHEATAQATRMKNNYRAKVKKMDLSRKVAKGNEISEAAAVQILGEAEDNIRVINQSRGRLKNRDGKTAAEWQAVIDDMWKNSPELDQAKIRNAVAEFRKIYDDLFRQMNETRIRNGYEPVNYRQGYFPHFQAQQTDGILAQFGKALGIDMEVTALPTTINGLTHTFKPGIQWNAHALERKGFNTVYDAVEGFDKYIEGVADVICQTDNIQRLRALASQIRYRTSDEGLRKQVDEIQARTDLLEVDKENRIKEVYEKGKFALSNFVVELDEYTNLLANKKSRADRNMEQAMGRDMYNLVKALESRVAANMVAINPRSWMTNFLPLAQGWAGLDTRNLLKGMGQTLMAIKEDDGIVDKSSFLTNRRGSDPLVRTWQQDASVKLSKPMEWIDSFTSDSLVRARYYQNLKQGLSEEEAIRDADQWAAGIMGDRSKGATPTIFNRSNPLTKIFTQFQLEVNNTLSYAFKDIPRDTRDKALAALAGALFKFFLGSWLYNEVFEYLFGDRPGLDPIGMLNGTVGDLTGYELPNLVELGAGAVTGEMPDFKTEKASTYEAAANLGVEAAEQMPFIGGLLGGGRVPISSALPDVENLGKAIFGTDTEDSEGWSDKKRLTTGLKELGKPLTYMALPFGGGQLKKIFEGFEAVKEGGSYSVDTQGNETLQYPIYSDNPLEMLVNYSRAMIFGKSTLGTAQDWAESGFNGLNAKQTAAYKGMVEAGVDGKAAFELLQQLRGDSKTENESDAAHDRGVLQESDISGEGKAIVYYGLLTNDAERELMDGLEESGADMGEVADVLMRFKDAKKSDTETVAVQQRRILGESALDADSKAMIYYDKLANESERELMDTMDADGINNGDIISTLLTIKDEEKKQDKLSAIAESSLSEKELEYLTGFVMGTELTTEKGKATQYADYLNAVETGLDPSEALELQADGIDLGDYVKLTDAGLDTNLAKSMVKELSALEPADGEDDISDAQKWRVAVDAGWDTKQQMQALSTVMSESAYRKAEISYEYGVEPKAYVRLKEILPQFDENKNGSFTNAEITKAIDSMSSYDLLKTSTSGDVFYLTNDQKAVLWQLYTGSSSAKNNPYDSAIGRKVIEAKKAKSADNESK